MDNGLIPYRYAKALYKYALEHGKTEDVYGISKLVIESFAQDPAMNKVLANPFVKNSDKEKILLTAAGNGRMRPTPDSSGLFLSIIVKSSP